jgi:CHAD domain-containing protein
VLREPGSQVLMLDLLAAAHVPSAPAGAGASANVESSAPRTVRAALAQRLNRWHRQLVADAGRFSELDDAGRHQLRKRAKRLRYAVEFCTTLFERRAVRRYLKALRALQDRLGALSDVVMAMQVYGRQHESDPRAMFALGWLTARRVLLIEAALPDLRAFAKTERFWKRR